MESTHISANVYLLFLYFVYRLPVKAYVIYPCPSVILNQLEEQLGLMMMIYQVRLLIETIKENGKLLAILTNFTLIHQIPDRYNLGKVLLSMTLWDSAHQNLKCLPIWCFPDVYYFNSLNFSCKTTKQFSWKKLVEKSWFREIPTSCIGII